MMQITEELVNEIMEGLFQFALSAYGNTESEWALATAMTYAQQTFERLMDDWEKGLGMKWEIIKTGEPTGKAPKPEKTEHKSLQELRLEKGFSQSELAKLAGMSVRSLQGYERRGRDLNLAAGATLYRIARALDVRVEDLLDTERID